ncbi:MAG: hypothetical protein DMF88_02765 [Acidobacteria bacterium]|nr:MAG: hypothetical protein DMF88_02765 [Acidobacteriota bacterium]
MMRTHALLRCSVLALILVAGTYAPAQAQGYVSPFIGVFSGDANCPSISNCNTTKVNGGLWFGKLGSVAGFEGELGYGKKLLGDAPGLDSSILTLMGNVLIAPKLTIFRPYVVGGLGLMRSTASLSAANVLLSKNNDFGWDLGGGLMVLFGHVGVRGDIRRFQSLQDVEVLGFTLSDSKIKFGRYTGALVFVF